MAAGSCKVLQGLIRLEGTPMFISRGRKTLRKILARMKESKSGQWEKMAPFAFWAEQYQSRWNGQSIWPGLCLLIKSNFI